MITDKTKLTDTDRKAAIILEDSLTDILSITKLVHQMALNQTYEVAHSPYEDDINVALFTAVSLLREKVAVFEKHYFHKGLEPEKTAS